MPDVFDQIAPAQAPATPQATGDVFDRLSQPQQEPGQELTPGEMLSTGAGIGIPGVVQGGAHLAGAVKGVGETAHTIGRVLNKLTGDNISWLPTSLQQPKALESSNEGETAGKIGEGIAEFALGDEALKGLSIMEKLGVAQKISKLAEESPTLAKIVNAGLTALRGSATGAAAGGLHEGVQGAETGAALGPVAEAVGAGLGKIGAFANIPSKAEAGELFSQVNEAIGNHPVIADKAAEIADEIMSQKEQFGTKLPGIKDTLNKFIDAARDPENPLTFKDAREFQKNFAGIPGATKAKMQGTIKSLLRELEGSLRESLQETADSASPDIGQKYREAMKGYRAASMAAKAKEHVKENAIRYMAGGGLVGEAYNTYKTATGTK